MMYEHEHEYNSSEKSKESTQSDSVLNEYYGKDRRKGQRLTPDTHWRVARQQGSAAFRCGGKARPWRPGKKKPAPPLRRLGSPARGASSYSVSSCVTCATVQGSARAQAKLSQTGYLRRATGVLRAPETDWMGPRRRPFGGVPSFATEWAIAAVVDGKTGGRARS